MLHIFVIRRDDNFTQATFADMGSDELAQLLSAEGDRRLCVFDQVGEFGCPVHRVDRHHHRIGAQNGEVTDDVLRAVLHVQQYAVACLNASLLQVAGQTLGFILQLTIADVAAVVVDGRMVRVAQRRDGDVVVQVGCR